MLESEEPTTIEAIDVEESTPIDESETKSTTDEKSTPFKIETQDDFKRMFSIIRGKDPDAQQIMNKFIDFDSVVERSNLPTHAIVHLVAFLDFVGLSFFPDIPNDPFSNLRDCISTAFMAKGGWKANGFVEIVKQTPSLAELQGLNEAIAPKGLRERFFGGKSNE